MVEATFVDKVLYFVPIYGIPNGQHSQYLKGERNTIMDNSLYLDKANKSTTEKSSAVPEISSKVILSLQQASSKPGTCITGALFEKLLLLIKQFNSNTAQVTPSEVIVHSQLTLLDQTEQIAYTWQCENNAQANETDRDVMSALLLEIEEKQTILVQKSPSLWIREGTENGVQEEMKVLWESITAGKGNIQIDQTDPQFVHSIRASITKLLQGVHGREILSTLNCQQESPDRIIWIGKDWQKKFANTRVEKDWKPGSWAFPYARIQNADATSHRQGGKGTGSYVQIDIKLSPPLVGLHNEPLYMPAFITLGHELGHAYHNLKELSIDPVNPPPGYFTDEAEKAIWSEPEEYQNITQNENQLRKEHGLPARQYHIDSKAFPEFRLLRLKLALMNRLTQAEGKIPSKLSAGVRKRLPQIEILQDILLVKFVEDDEGEDKPLWKVPGQLEKAELLMKHVEQHLDDEIANEDRCTLM